jgi:hypothetical protein
MAGRGIRGSSVTSISHLALDVFSEQLSQLLLPFDAPGGNVLARTRPRANGLKYGRLGISDEAGQTAGTTRNLSPGAKGSGPMPWTPEDGPARHTEKANTPKKKRQWAKIANGALERGESEQSAIMQADGVLQSVVVAYARASSRCASPPCTSWNSS